MADRLAKLEAVKPVDATEITDRLSKLEAALKSPNAEQLQAALSSCATLEQAGRDMTERVAKLENAPPVVVDEEKVNAALQNHPEIARFRNFLDRHNL